MTVDQTYLVDSDVFITAKNLYYAFDICPGFWKSVVHHHRAGRVFSIDRVRSELLAGHKTEDLVRWVRNDIPSSFFIPVDTDAVVRAYTDIMMWVQRHPRYFDIAKAKFATAADGWLVAYARRANAKSRGTDESGRYWALSVTGRSDADPGSWPLHCPETDFAFALPTHGFMAAPS